MVSHHEPPEGTVAFLYIDTVWGDCHSGNQCMCLYPSMFHISCTKLYVKYREGMLGYCPIPLYPNSIYMIVLNVLHSARRKLSMKLQPHLPAPPFPHAFLPFLMPSSPSSCLPPLPHAFLPFLMPSSPSPCLPPLPLASPPLLLHSSPFTTTPITSIVLTPLKDQLHQLTPPYKP